MRRKASRPPKATPQDWPDPVPTPQAHCPGAGARYPRWGNLAPPVTFVPAQMSVTPPRYSHERMFLTMPDLPGRPISASVPGQDFV
jgi:hypothetical protein